MAGVKDIPLQPKGFQQLTPAAATALTVPAGARFAMFNIDTASATFRDDGTDPTAAIGMILTVGTNYWYTGILQKVKFISATGHVNVSYYA